MKLRAIRLKEFRRFTEPVAVEGLSGGLDVLAAPNEDGKSTLFEAVRTVINEKYNAGGSTKKIKAIQPYAGGAPLIEVDFDLDGREYRLRKQFVKKADAVLSDRATGRDVARKDDVEDWLGKHLKKRLPFGLFWIAQHGGVSPDTMQKAADEHVPALRSVVEAEVGAITGGATRDLVRKSINADLSTLVTSRAPKKNGPYDLSLASFRKIEGDIATARQRKADAEDRQARLDALRDERQALVSSPEYAALGTRIAAAQKAINDAMHANRQLRDARKEQETSEHQLAAASQQLAEFDARAADFLALTEEQSEARTALEGLKREVDEAEKSFAADETQLKALKQKLAELQQLERAAVLAGQRRVLTKEIARQEGALANAQEAMKRVSEARKFVASEIVTSDKVQTLKTIRDEIASLELQAEQQIPKVTVHYDAGADGRVYADGEPLANGMARQVREKTDLAIDGIGRLSIDPGTQRNREEDEADLHASQEQRDQLMDQLGVTSIEEAKRRATDRDKRISAAQLDEQRLQDLAPDGIEVLERVLNAERAKLDALPPVDPSITVRPNEDVRADIAALEPQISEKSGTVEQKRSELQELKVRTATHEADIKSRDERLTQIGNRLDRNAANDPIGREANRNMLADAARVAEERLNAATRTVSGWLEAFVSDEKLETLHEALADVRKEATASQATLRKVDQERGEIEAVLRETSQDGIDEVLGNLEGALERAAQEVAYHERRIAALKLLSKTMDEVAEETRASYTRPIVERLSPYVNAVFPGADLSFTEQFSASGILRSGNTEHFSDVSMGTQEQIGVLIRLGFARLFADQGQPLPLILDDALVYSDDQRIERMFDALRLAAQEHQVLILTCRMRAFEGLGGHRLKIQPSTFD